MCGESVFAPIYPVQYIKSCRLIVRSESINNFVVNFHECQEKVLLFIYIGRYVEIETISKLIAGPVVMVPAIRHYTAYGVICNSFSTTYQ
jgi:hypothetical protein